MSAADLLTPESPAASPRRRVRAQKTALERLLAFRTKFRRAKDLADHEVSATERASRKRLRAAGNILSLLVAEGTNMTGEYTVLQAALEAAKGTHFVKVHRTYFDCLVEVIEGEDIQAIDMACADAARLIENSDFLIIANGLDMPDEGLEFLKVAIYAVVCANCEDPPWERARAGAAE